MSSTRRQSQSRPSRSKIEKPKGLLTQLDENPPEATNTLPLEQISQRADQPRRYFSPEAMQQLVESVKVNGILQPLLVRPLEGGYELVAGERRLRAAKEAGLEEVPVMVREMTDALATQFALTENLQREDLNPVEETEGILQLLEMKLGRTRVEVTSLLNRMSNAERGLTDNVISSEDEQVINEVFAAIGRLTPESFRVNRLPLLKLPEDILEALHQGRIEYTKAKEIAKLKDDNARQQLLESAIAQGLSLNQIKERVKELKPAASLPAPTQKEIKQLSTKASRVPKLVKEAAQRLQEPEVFQKAQKLLSEIEALLAPPEPPEPSFEQSSLQEEQTEQPTLTELPAASAWLGRVEGVMEELGGERLTQD